MTGTVNTNFTGKVPGQSYGTEGTNNQANAPTTPTDNGVVELDTAKVLEELTAMLKSMGTTSAGGTSGAERTAPAGAPNLDAPGEDFSADQLALLIGAMQNKITELQGKTAREGIKLSETQKQEAHQKAIAKIEEMAQKIAEAKAKSKILGILGIIGKILALVVAAAATVLTAGAAAPIAAAILVYTVIDTVMMVADEISKAVGGPRLALDHLMTQGFAKMAEAFGADPEKAKEIGQWMAFSVQIAVAIASIASGVGAAKAAAKGAEMAFKVGDNVMKLAKLAQIGGTAANAVNMVAQGATTIAHGHNEKDAAEAAAKKAELDKLIMLLGMQMEEESERVKKLVEELDQAMQELSTLINSAGDTRMQQIRNIV